MCAIALFALCRWFFFLNGEQLKGLSAPPVFLRHFLCKRQRKYGRACSGVKSVPYFRSARQSKNGRKAQP
jgi:hypothetical protein